MARNVIYTYPTITTLASHIHGLLRHPSTGTTKSIVNTHVEAIEEMIRRYGFSPVETRPPRLHNSSNSLERTVLLTGSTGHLGSQILNGLVCDPTIRKVYTMNRPSTSQTIFQRHSERFRDKDMDEDILESPKIVYLETEYSDTKLGLSDDLYSEVSPRVYT